jgi:hypothetical protein
MKKICSPLYFIVPSLTLLFIMLGKASCTSSIPTIPTATSVAFIVSPTVSPTSIPASPTSTVLISTLRSTRTTQIAEFPADNKYPRPTYTPRPTPTPMPTAYPTLDSQGRLNFVLNALKTNRGCALPCWWGITPGKTTWEEMVNTFARQGIGLDVESNQLFLSIDNDKGYAEQAADVTFAEQDGRVQNIDIDAEYYHVLAEAKYSEVWRNYTLDKVLTHYGIPTEVYLHFTTEGGDWAPGISEYYDLWLVYDNRGIAIRYPGELIHDARGWYTCPVFGNVGGIEFRLYSPMSQPFTPDSESRYGPFISFSGTLKELTSLSLHEFYTIFNQEPPTQCLLVSDPHPWWYDKITLPKPSVILPVTQEEEYLVNNLSSNADCELPCWWGIKPGETTTQYVQQMFLNLGKSVSRNEDSRGLQYRVSLFGRHSPYPFDYTVEHRWFDQNGIVILFGVTGTALNWSPPQHFTQDWNRYALHEALARYGVPSKVLVHYWNFGWRYDITLVYEDKGFLIRYSGPINDAGDETSTKPMVICPVQNKPTEITIWMTKPAGDVLAKFQYGRWDLSPSHSPMPSLEEVTNMSVQTFYETFLNPNATTCLTVPRNKGEMAP